MFYVAPLPSVENRRGENWEKQQASVRRRGGVRFLPFDVRLSFHHCARLESEEK